MPVLELWAEENPEQLGAMRATEYCTELRSSLIKENIQRTNIDAKSLGMEVKVGTKRRVEDKCEVEEPPRKKMREEASATSDFHSDVELNNKAGQLVNNGRSATTASKIVYLSSFSTLNIEESSDILDDSYSELSLDESESNLVKRWMTKAGNSTMIGEDFEAKKEDIKIDKDFAKISHNTKRIKYIWLILGIYTCFALYAVVDRFLYQYRDSPQPDLLSKHWGGYIFIILQWISGRMMIVGQIVLMVTQMKCFWTICSDFAPNCGIDYGDISHVNNTIHRFAGCALICIPLLIHIYSMIFPIMQGAKFELLDVWGRPEGDPYTFYDERGEKGRCIMGGNDYWRFIFANVSVLILFPYSMCSRSQKWNFSFAMWVHILAGGWFTFSNLRVFVHIRSQIYCTPFVISWALDRTLSFFYRRHTAEIKAIMPLGDDYAVVFLKTNHTTKRQIGDCCWYNIPACKNLFHYSHPFTTFSNHLSLGLPSLSMFTDKISKEHKFRIDQDENGAAKISRAKTTFGDLDQDEALPGADRKGDWDTAYVMQIHEPSDCFMSPSRTWTQQIASGDYEKLCGYGPMHSEYKTMMWQHLPELILIGTGSGGAYIIDFQQYIIANKIKLKKKVQVLYTSRSVELFQFTTDYLSSVNIKNFEVNASLTNKESQFCMTERTSIANESSGRNIGLGRPAIISALEKASKNTVVYYCGSPGLQDVIAANCKNLSLTFRAGHAFHTK